MKNTLIALLILTLFISYGKTVTKPTGDNDFGTPVVNGQSIVAGDTVLAATGTHLNQQRFVDFIGTKANPIVIDYNGQTIDANGMANVVYLLRCEWVTLINIGDGYGAINYGIVSTDSKNCSAYNNVIHDVPNTCIRMGLSTNSEADSTEWREHFQEEKTVVNGNTCYNCGREGIYVGNSNSDTWYVSSTYDTIYQQAWGDTLIVDDNTVYNIDWDGIQFSAGISYTKVTGNTVYDYALDGQPVHSNGIQVGPGSKGIVANNLIYDGNTTEATSAAISSTGEGMEFFNNVIIDAFQGIALPNRYTTGNQFLRVYNNTFVRIVDTGIYNESWATRGNWFINNIFHHVTEPDDVDTFYELTQKGGYSNKTNNLFVYGASWLATNLTDVDNQDVTPTGGSAALNTGANLYHYYHSLLTQTYSDTNRPFYGSWNIGAE